MTTHAHTAMTAEQGEKLYNGSQCIFQKTYQKQTGSGRRYGTAGLTIVRRLLVIRHLPQR